MITRVQDWGGMSAVDSLFSTNEEKIVTSQKQEKETYNAKDHKSKKLNNNFNANNRLTSISSSLGSDNEGAYGSSSSNVGLGISNTIIDTNVIDNLTKEMSSKERIELEKKAELKRKEDFKLALLNEIPNDIDTRSDKTICGFDAKEKTTQSSNNNNIGMFGYNMDFSNLPERTAGEKLGEKTAQTSDKQKEFENSIINDKEILSSKNSTDNLFDLLINNV